MTEPDTQGIHDAIVTGGGIARISIALDVIPS